MKARASKDLHRTRGTSKFFLIHIILREFSNITPNVNPYKYSIFAFALLPRYKLLNKVHASKGQQLVALQQSGKKGF